MKFADDPFDAISNLNIDSYNAGFREGVLNGKKLALTQGFNVGIQTSFKIAKEIGNIYGTCSLYKQQQVEQNSEKVIKLAQQICDLIEAFDITDCHRDSFESNMNLIKDKFKQFCSLTNTKSVNLKTDSRHLNF